MSHFNHPIERVRRWLCRVFGHKFKTSTYGEPVVPAIDICIRCGKFERTYWPKNKDVRPK